MNFKVLLTEDAARDLEDIYLYMLTRDSVTTADAVLEKIEKAIATLAQHPNRGTVPLELRVVGLREFREVFFKPYRIIYRVIDRNVYVLLVTDGRRDMQALLERRLLSTSF